MRSRDLWFRPIETRVGPDGALYVIDFYNQAVIHNDTRGPQHGPANAAVRPDRDHYFGRIWRVQHKQAKKLDVPALDRARPRRPHPRDGDEPERAREADGVAPRAGEPRVGPAPRTDQAADGQQGARSCTNGRAPRRRPRSARRMLDSFARATDNWTRVGASSPRRPSRRRRLRGRGVHARSVRRRWPSFVAAIVPAALPAKPAGCSSPAAGAGPDAAGAQGRRRPGRGAGCTAKRHRHSTRHDAALQTLLDDPATTAAVLPVVAKWDKAGALRATAEQPRVARCCASSATPTTSDDRRVDIAASLLALPRTAPEALADDRADARRPGRSEPLQERLIATLGERHGQRRGRRAGRRAGAGQLDAALRSAPEAPESVAGAARGDQGRQTVTPSDLGPANVARLRTHPNKAGRDAQAAALSRHADRRRRRRRATHRHAAAGGREARRRGARQGALHRHLRDVPQARRRRHERGRTAAQRHGRARPRRAARRRSSTRTARSIPASGSGTSRRDRARRSSA